ncbi:peroxidase-related enzyme [Shewanella gelidii]|uniref:Alkyl hydroperoxide reductase AhpD n=1 Tax=Shewanella gelidii TaxID=1642821 RepID=A0A917N8S7_9GAMM|nr:peroxidase-related enzyme [Shewanella gelidii]MCL1097002.1 peroxidase-related enzyme [Shewanella gelidii]GGI71847.1 alkyl hydroperoxide reductase AhpD [Shewanella gelidii]
MKQPDASISRFPVPEFDTLPGDIKDAMLSFQEKLGFVPNVLFALAHRPAELRAFLAYNEATMAKESGLTAAEKEMLIIAFSNQNGCTYCVMSHGAVLRLESGDKYLAEKIAVNYREANISPRQKAMIAFALKMTKEPSTISTEDFESLHAHGLSDEDIWDIGGITAFFNLSNRMMDLLAVRPDDEFFMMGR